MDKLLNGDKILGVDGMLLATHPKIKRRRKNKVAGGFSSTIGVSHRRTGGSQIGARRRGHKATAPPGEKEVHRGNKSDQEGCGYMERKCTQAFEK